MSKHVYEVIRESCTQGGGFLSSFYDKRSMGIYEREADAIGHKKIFADESLPDSFMDTAQKIYDDDSLTTFVAFKASNRITPEMEMISYSISERWVD